MERRPLCEDGQRHRANAFAGLGAVDDLNVEDDAVVFDGPGRAHRFDQRRHVEELLTGEVHTIRDSRGRLRITQIAVLAVQQRTESCVSHVHDRLDGSMNILFLYVVADGNLRHREG